MAAVVAIEVKAGGEREPLSFDEGCRRRTSSDRDSSAAWWRGGLGRAAGHLRRPRGSEAGHCRRSEGRSVGSGAGSLLA